MLLFISPTQLPLHVTHEMSTPWLTLWHKSNAPLQYKITIGRLGPDYSTRDHPPFSVGTQVSTLRIPCPRLVYNEAHQNATRHAPERNLPWDPPERNMSWNPPDQSATCHGTTGTRFVVVPTRTQLVMGPTRTLLVVERTRTQLAVYLSTQILAKAYT